MHQSIRHKLDILKTLSIIGAPYGLKNMTLKNLSCTKEKQAMLLIWLQDT